MHGKYPFNISINWFIMKEGAGKASAMNSAPNEVSDDGFWTNA